jgi:hypothetical protein
VHLDTDEAERLLASATHGVLCTAHQHRGVDPVPCVYAVAGDLVGIPVDTVKDKSTIRLQREINLEVDPRAALLVEHQDPNDRSRLLWVRAELLLQPDPAPDVVAGLAGVLADRITQYRQRPFAGMIVLQVTATTGWSTPAV